MFNATWDVRVYHFLVPRMTAVIPVVAWTTWTAMEPLRVRLPWLSAQVQGHPSFRRMLRPGEDSRISGAVWSGWSVVAIPLLFPRPAHGGNVCTRWISSRIS